MKPGTIIVMLIVGLMFFATVDSMLTKLIRYQEFDSKERETICEKVLSIEGYYTGRINESVDDMESGIRPAKVKECTQFSKDCVPGFIIETKEDVNVN